jgi:opacity protein-like surface antigen
MKLILFFIMLLLSNAVAFGGVITQIVKRNQLVKISTTQSYASGSKTYFYNKKNMLIAIGAIKSCSKNSCLVTLKKMSRKHPPLTGFRARVKDQSSAVSSNRKNHLILSVEASYSKIFGLGYQRILDNGLWRLGLNYELIKDKVAKTGINGNAMSLEAQRRIWSKENFSVYGLTKLGLLNVEFDFTEFDATEPKKNMSAYFINIGADGDYKFSDNFSAQAGAGMGYNSLENEITGKAGIYVSDFDGIYTYIKASVRYHF